MLMMSKSRISTLLISVFIVLGTVNCSFSSGNTSEYALVPEVQQIIKTGAPNVLPSATWSVVLKNHEPWSDNDTSVPLDSSIISQELILGLKKKGIRLDFLDGFRKRTNSNWLVIGNPEKDHSFNELCKKYGIDVSELPFDEGDSRYGESYIIDVKQDRDASIVIVAARGDAGLLYGVQTLIQLIEKDGSMPAVKILDYPDSKWRGYYVNFRSFKGGNGRRIGPRLDDAAVQNIIDEIANYSRYKINTIILDGKVFDRLDQENMKYLDQIFKECRRRFIEPIPTVSSLLWGKAVKNLKKEFAKNIQGFWVKNEPFVIAPDGFAQPVKPIVSLVKNGSFERDFAEGDSTGSWVFNSENSRNAWGQVKSTVSNRSFMVGKSGVGAAVLTINKPHNYSKLALETTVSGGFLPGEYYELNFWSRGNGSARLTGKLNVVHYNDSGRSIDEMSNNFGFDFFASGRYVPNWEPVFTHKNTSKITFRFSPYRHGGSKGDIYVDDVELIRMNGAMVNVLHTPENSFDVTNDDGSIKYVQGVDYKVIPGPLYIKPRKSFADLKPTRVKILPGSKLVPGDKIRISYDSLVLNPMHRNSRLSTSSPGTYSYYYDRFKQLISLNVRYINIHLSEHQGGFNRDSRDLKRGMSNAELLATFVNNLNNLITKKGEIEVLPQTSFEGINNPGVRLLMWDDVVNYWHNGGGKRGEGFYMPYGGVKGSTYLALHGTPLPQDQYNVTGSKIHIPRSVIMASWWYRNRDSMGVMKNSPRFYSENGYDFVGTTWDRPKNIQSWSESLHENSGLGLISSAWGLRKKGIIPTADVAWKSVKKRNK